MDMVERVARALWEDWRMNCRSAKPHVRKLSWGMLQAQKHKRLIAEIIEDAHSQARAVLAAMYDPTEAMLLAAYRTPARFERCDNETELAFAEYLDKWRAMIDAAAGGHIDSMDCWCQPERDSQEPTVIIHKRAQ